MRAYLRAKATLLGLILDDASVWVTVGSRFDVALARQEFERAKNGLVAT